jgi:phosphohistidine phosphatase
VKILFLRHAEAVSQYEDDFNRPLTEYGKKQVREVANHLSIFDLSSFDLSVSPARRALETLDLLCESLKIESKYQTHDFLYSGDVNQYLDAIRETTSEKLLIVGHNPVISEAASTLSSMTISLKTAGWVLVDFDLKTSLGAVILGSELEGNY